MLFYKTWLDTRWRFLIGFALLLIVALLVERFLPRSLHPRRELAGALVTVISASYLITATLRRLPPGIPGVARPA